MTRRPTTIKGVAAHLLNRPQNSECKYRLETFHLDGLASTRHSLHWLSPKGQNYQRGVLLIPAGVIEGYFEGKKPVKLTKIVSFLHENATAHRALATQKKLCHCAAATVV
jgi:hypothetical protein